MIDPIIQSCTQLLEFVFRYEVGSDYFYILLAATAFVFSGTTWFLAKTFGGNAGVVLAVFASLLPVALGIIGFALAAVYLVPMFEADWAPAYLPWSAFALFALLVILIASQRMLGVGVIVSIVIFVMASAAGAIAYYGSDALLKMADKGNQGAIQEKKTRAIDQIVD